VTVPSKQTGTPTKQEKIMNAQHVVHLMQQATQQFCNIQVIATTLAMACCAEVFQHVSNPVRSS
jgi:hypothetical protein